MATTRAALVDAATDLNKALDLSPAIDVKQGVEKLKDQIKEAAELLSEIDVIEGATRAVIDALTGNGEAGEAEAEETEAEEEEAGEVKTAPKKPVAKTKAKETAKATASKPEAASTRNSGGRAYEGSQAERMDTAAMKGGTIEQIAEASGLPVARVKFHIRHRETISKAKWNVARKGNHVKLSKRESAAA